MIQIMPLNLMMLFCLNIGFGTAIVMRFTQRKLNLDLIRHQQQQQQQPQL
jgi:hypothetical protein